MKDLLLLYLLIINAAGFGLMLADKHKAKKNLWRIPEATLMTVAALGGTMIPVGDAKGAALALMVEILSATLTGANHAYEASSFFEPTGSAPGIGQTFILLDPKPLNPDFSARLEALCGHLLGQEGVRLPGERRFMLRERNRVSGVNLPEALYNDLRKRAGVA